MRNIYNNNRKYILIPSLILVMVIFVNIVGVNSAIAKKDFHNWFNFRSTKWEKVLGIFDTHKENKDEDEDKETETQTVEGDLTCGFDGSPIFDISNMLPGDSETRQVTVQNTGSVPVIAALKGVRTGPDGETDPLLEEILDFDIYDDITSIYSNKLQGFFDESVESSNGAQLAILNPGDNVIYDLTVGFPDSAGNEYQEKQVVFDLVCGKLTAKHVVINEVFYNVDGEHGIDSWKDHGSPQREQKKGQDGEWIELYNPTDHDILLKNWTLEDNSGEKFVIHSRSIIKAGGFALIAKDKSMWKYWDENRNAIKIQSDKFLGDGLDNDGDHLVLWDDAGNEVDFVRWGNDETSGFAWTEVASDDPAADNGFSIERLAPGFDNDLSSDWIDQASHSPTS